MQTLILRVPGLAWLDQFSMADIVPFVETPHLNRLLSHASLSRRLTTLSEFDTQPWGDNLAVTSTLLIQNAGLPQIKDKQWLIADPCHLRVERDAVQLSDIGVISLGMEEVEGLIDSLNDYFKEEDWQWYASQPDQWFVAIPTRTQTRFTPTSDVVGENMLMALPQGEDRQFWNQKLNDIQMLLFNHPINQAREEKGELPVNGVWIWGDKTLSGRVLLIENALQASCYFSDSHTSKLAAKAVGLPFDSAPYSWEALLASVHALRKSGIVVVEIDGLLAPAQYRDAYGWKQAIEDLEQRWFAPLFAALQSGQLKQLTIQTHGDMGFEANVSRWRLWQFWRTLKPLHKTLITMPD